MTVSLLSLSPSIVVVSSFRLLLLLDTDRERLDVLILPLLLKLGNEYLLFF